MANFIVPARSEAEISELAHLYRGMSKEPNRLNVAEFLLDNVIGRKIKKRLVTLDLYEKDHAYDDPAYVSFSPETISLNVDRAVWQECLKGGDEENVILAHELGHIAQHDHTAKAFSPEHKLTSSRDEEKSEWQAETFLGAFLIPDEMIWRLRLNEGLISVLSGVDRQRVAKRLKLFLRGPGKGLVSNLGEPCPTCANFTLAQIKGQVCCTFCSWKPR